MAIGERILQAAKAAGITQAILAQRLGISQAAMSLWGKGGVPSGNKIPEIAEILGVTVEHLVGDKESSTGETDLSALRAEVARLTAELAAQTEISRQLSAYNRILEERIASPAPPPSAFCSGSAG
jgi:transcriptional regulator with XRE-family HTH domain